MIARPRFRAYLPGAFALAALASCQLAPGTELRPGLRASTVIAEGYDGEVTFNGATVEERSDYTNFEGGLVLSTWRAGRKVSTGEILVSKTEFDDLDATEISGGGRWFVGGTDRVRPFVGVHATNILLDDIAGVEFNSGLGVRVGAGFEVPLGQPGTAFHGVYVDLGVDYLIPIFEAESNTVPVIESEVEGFAVRVGVGVDF